MACDQKFCEGMMLKTVDIYDFLKEKYDKDNFIRELTGNFSFSVAGCRSYRRPRVLHFQQHPWELLELMNHLKDENINSYMEMGISFCNTFCLMDSFFRTRSPNYEESVGVDIEDKSEILKEYQIKFTTCKFVQTNVTQYKFERDFDYIFIDTNQRYGNIMETFNLCLPHARYIGFHDISARRWGAQRVFTELSDKYEHWSWSRSGAGIGLLKIK